MPPATASGGGGGGGGVGGYSDDVAYPSRNIAFQAAGMITAIVEQLQSHDELRFTPAFVYVLDLRSLSLPTNLIPVYTVYSRHLLCTSTN